MAQTVTTAAGTSQEVAARMIEKLQDHADAFGVGVDGELAQGLQNFLADVVKEEREEAAHDESYEGLTADVANRLGEALQRFAKSVERGNF